MDSFSIFKYENVNPQIILKLNISGEDKYWLIPSTEQALTSGKKIAFETGDETYQGTGELLQIDSGRLEIKYHKKKKIEFTAFGEGPFSGDYVLYIPSWGLNTKKKIWVLIPPAKM